MLILRRRFFLIRKRVNKKRKMIASRGDIPNWKKAGESFNRLIKENKKEIVRLCDARTYRDLYLEDGIEPPC